MGRCGAAGLGATGLLLTVDGRETAVPVLAGAVLAGEVVCTTRGATTAETLLDVPGGVECDGCRLTAACGAGSGAATPPPET